MEFITGIFGAFSGILDMLKGGEVAGVLNMVKEILVYINEFEAAGIIDIIAGFFA